MKNSKYLVCRDSIYVGEVVKTDSIHRLKSDMFYQKAGQLDVSFYRSFRSMLFVTNEEKLADDLLYNSPNYPSLNVTDDEKCLKLNESNIVIRNSYNLSLLLEYFNYKKYLTIKDIINIRKTFFTGRFGMDNSKLFGMKEFVPYNFKAYKHGKEITNEEEIYELYKKSLSLGSERQFGSIPDNVLPRELMDILDERGRSNYGTTGDIFEPNIEEGPIRKLTRF